MAKHGLKLGLALVALAATCSAWAAAASAGTAVYARPLSARIGTVGDPRVSQSGPPICNFGDYQPVCYAPSHIREAYNYPDGPGAPTGAGQTIVLIDAFGSPTIQADLALFDTHFGIAAPPSLDVVCPQAGDCGTPPNPDTAAGWALETSLDVEYAHAMAPGAKLVLAVSSSDEWSNLRATELAMIRRYPGAIISESFGLSEPTRADLPTLRQVTASFGNHLLALRLRTTIVAAAGDFGSTDGVTDANGKPVVTADYPSSDPLVTGVGGTQGATYPTGLWVDGHYGAEHVWNESYLGLADGGGPSALFPLPSYQRGLLAGYRKRMSPDVAYNAALDGGVLVVDSIGGRARLDLVGGNSAGAPQWAGIFALANELRGKQGKPGVGFANPLLYSIGRDRARSAADFHDILVGNDLLQDPFVDPSLWPTVGFSAGPGYDLTTGWGTPDVANLLTDLVGKASPQVEEPDSIDNTGGTGSHQWPQHQDGRPAPPKPHDQPLPGD